MLVHDFLVKNATPPPGGGPKKTARAVICVVSPERVWYTIFDSKKLYHGALLRYSLGEFTTDSPATISIVNLLHVLANLAPSGAIKGHEYYRSHKATWSRAIAKPTAAPLRGRTFQDGHLPHRGST